MNNGSHPSRISGYFEWWYFHFFTDDGWYINFILHATDIFSADRKSYMSMSLLSPKRQSYYFRREFGEQLLSPNSEFLVVNLNGCTLVETGSEITLDLLFSGASFQATIWKAEKPLIIQDGLLYKDGRTGLENYWFVPVPHASFEAQIDIHLRSERLSGSAYHDHNWGDAKIQDHFSSWLWGHLKFERGFLVYYFIETVQGTPIGQALLNLEGVSTVLDMFILKPIQSKEFSTVHELPTRYEMTMQVLQGRLRVWVSIGQQFRKREILCYRGFVPLYYRASCTAQFKIGSVRFSGGGLAEYLFIDRRPTWALS